MAVFETSADPISRFWPLELRRRRENFWISRPEALRPGKFWGYRERKYANLSILRVTNEQRRPARCHLPPPLLLPSLHNAMELEQRTIRARVMNRSIVLGSSRASRHRSSTARISSWRMEPAPVRTGNPRVRAGGPQAPWRAFDPRRCQAAAAPIHSTAAQHPRQGAKPTRLREARPRKIARA